MKSLFAFAVALATASLAVAVAADLGGRAAARPTLSTCAFALPTAAFAQDAPTRFAQVAPR